MSLQVIRPFDPWRTGSLCTCPFKYTVNPYTGCGHRCIYCYITAYIKDAFNPRPKRDLIARAERDLRRIPKGSIINVSSSSDPYTPPEDRLMLTRRLLAILVKDYILEIVTKSSLVVRDLDIISKGKSLVQMTITTMDLKVAERLEPNAPKPIERIKALKAVGGAGVPTVLRLDPILPGLNDNIDSIRRVIEEAVGAGVKHVVTSTYKAKPDSLRRVLAMFPELRDKYKTLYIEEGERIHGALYLPRKIRRRILKTVREIAHEYGLTFATCREGFPELHDRDVTCNGVHLVEGWRQ